jgi:phage repressor protein C with HTH and peptisase S24 domain
MMPTIEPGKLLVASRTSKIKKGNLVIAKVDEREIVKRVSEVKHSKIYVLGDNSNASTDSREFGWLNKSQIIGKIIWPQFN